MTQRQLHHQSPLQQWWQHTKTGDLECTTPATRSTGRRLSQVAQWCEYLSSSVSGPYFFQEARLVWESSSSPWGGRGVVNLVSFRGFLKILSCLLLNLRSISAKWIVSPPLRTSSVQNKTTPPQKKEHPLSIKKPPSDVRVLSQKKLLYIM